MDWLLQNWFWVVALVLFFAMHIFGHGGHGSGGGHGGHAGHGGGTDETRPPSDIDDQEKAPPHDHQH